MIPLYKDPFAPPPSGYTVARAPDDVMALLDPVHDGWRGASTIEWGPARYRTRFAALWSPDALAIRFDAADDGPWHTMTGRDDHLWEEEVVEIFLDPSRSGRDYAELEISPANVVCDLRVRRPAPDFANDIAWDWTGMRSRVVLVLDGGGAPAAWTAIAALPWAPLATLSAEAAARVPPRAGDQFDFNVFRIKRPGGPADRTAGAVLAAWSVPEGYSFHVPGAFRPFRFV